MSKQKLSHWMEGLFGYTFEMSPMVNLIRSSFFGWIRSAMNHTSDRSTGHFDFKNHMTHTCAIQQSFWNFVSFHISISVFYRTTASNWTAGKIATVFGLWIFEIILQWMKNGFSICFGCFFLSRCSSWCVYVGAEMKLQIRNAQGTLSQHSGIQQQCCNRFSFFLSSFPLISCRNDISRRFDYISKLKKKRAKCFNCTLRGRVLVLKITLKCKRNDATVNSFLRVKPTKEQEKLSIDSLDWNVHNSNFNC